MRIIFCCVVLASLVACAGKPASQSLNSNDTRLRVAEAAASSGDIHLAESVYANAAAAAPSDTKLQLDYADALVRANKIVEARNLLVGRIHTVREPSRLHGPLGTLYLLTGQPTQAINEFEAAADPNNSRWLIDKGIAYDMLGKHVEAQTLYHKALAADPDDYIAITDLSLSLALSGQKDAAAQVASALAGRSDLPQRAVLTYDVVRAANGNDVSNARQTMGTTGYEQLMQMAKTIGSKTN